MCIRDRGQLLDGLLDDVADIAEQAFKSIGKPSRKDEDEIEAHIAAKIKKAVKQDTGKRTIVEVTVHKV